MFNDLLRILRPEGRYTTAGAIAGPVVELDLRTMYLKHLELHGSSQGTRTAFRRLAGYIQEGRIRPLLDRTFRLSDFPDRSEERRVGRGRRAGQWPYMRM